jgi:hypothetical protein
MPSVGFKPMILMLEWAKTVYALDCAATVIGSLDVFQTHYSEPPIQGL